MADKRFNWAKPVRNALDYFNRMSIPIGDIIENVIEKGEAIRECSDKEDLIARYLSNKICKSMEERANIDIIALTEHFPAITVGCLIYYVAKVVDGKDYRDFSEFVDENRKLLG